MAIKKRLISPRQKMINLMYVVLMAMLAMNVSSDVLQGFSLIEDSLAGSTIGAQRENATLYTSLETMMKNNPAKTKPWYDKALSVKASCDSMIVFTELLKKEIIRNADGKDAEIQGHRLVNKEDMEAVAQVMLSPSTERATLLYENINSFRNEMASLITDSLKRKTILDNLSTAVPEDAGGKNWQQYMFESMPAAAAMTMLTKLQSDVRHAEGTVLHTLMRNIDSKDIRVNALRALVIPNTQTVVRGNRFTADIVLAAMDTTQKPEVFIGERKVDLKDGRYHVVCNNIGDFTLSGWLQTTDNEGFSVKRPFIQKYAVVEPTATVSADLMNVLYAGYDNPISVSVPGVASQKVVVTAEGATLRQVSPGHYIARPQKVGGNTVITVFSEATGVRQQMARYSFQNRKLPEPTPYFNVGDEKGNSERFAGGNIGKAVLMEATELHAAVDDGILNIPFRVISFETVFFGNMGNAVPMVSEGNKFSQRQKDVFAKLQRGRRFYISRVNAIGPDGIERKLKTSLEVIVR